MSVLKAIENLSYEQKKYLSMSVIHDENVKNNKVMLTDNYLNSSIEGYLLNHSQKYSKDIIELWLIYIKDILEHIVVDETIFFMTDVLKKETNYNLDNYSLLDDLYLNDRIEAICRNMVLLLSETNIHQLSKMNVREVIRENDKVVMSRLSKLFEKKIGFNKLKIRNMIKKKEIKRNRKYVGIIFLIYIYNYLRNDINLSMEG